MQAKKVIFDTDPGVDDAMALMLLACSPEVELLGVCTTFGNGAIDTTTRNALYLAERLGLRAGVHRGAAAALDGAQHAPPVQVHGHNALGDIALPNHIGRAVSGRSAHGFLIDTLRRHPGEVSLLAVGPLTNLALALRQAPDIAALAREVVVMGGAFGHRGHGGNVTPFAEANIHADPVAADEVFGARWPVTIVGLDVTHQTIMTTDYLRALAAEAGELGALIWEMSRVYQAFHRDTGVEDGFYVHDASAVACLLAPALFGLVRGPVRVDTRGETVGRTWLDEAAAARPAQSVCREVDADAVLALYRERLRAD
ncbi:nucleoside hydrolase [Azohydromonas caseinilytica]|uniref:Nucleoside hydrolase n=1 Tax=Azohydromonas caseinilytica TaxID=2728836 RepID=A0A848FH64_9BURK|nr:nucleoside hydrolase [Azohydromonas caseinilytica]NML18674.1 nucleoside hydrolase [Azohydromonas caseinilytica]